MALIFRTGFFETFLTRTLRYCTALPSVHSMFDSREYVTFNENLYFAPFCVAPSRDEICCGWSWKILQSDVTFLLRKQHKTSPKNTAIDEDPCQMLASPSQTYQAFPYIISALVFEQNWFPPQKWFGLAL